MLEITARQRLRLPVLTTVASAYGSLPANLGVFLRIAWLPLLIIGTLAYVLYTIKYQVLLDTQPDRRGALTSPLADILMPLVLWPLMSSIAVAWHLYLLRGERPRGWFQLRFDGRVWKYLGFVLLMGLGALMLIGPPTIVLSIAGVAANLGSFALLAPLLVVSVCALTYIARFALVLPVLALGRRLPIEDVLHKTRGNALPIAAGSVLTAAPVIACVAALYQLWPVNIDQWTASSMAMLTTAAVLLSVVLMSIHLDFLSNAYRHFLGAPPPEPH